MKMTLLALKGEVSSFCKVWIVRGSIPRQTKPYPVQNALEGGVWTRLRINKRFSAVLAVSLTLHAGLLFFAPRLSSGAAEKTSAAPAKVFSLVNIAPRPEDEKPAPRKPEPVKVKPLPKENSPDGIITEIAAPPTPAARADIPAAVSPKTETREDFFVRYAHIIRGHIDKHKEYPYAARRQEQEGSVRVRFTLSRTGLLVGDPVPEEKSRHQRLNAAAIEAVRKAQPYPAFPPELSGPELTFSVTVSFLLK
ncbi:MAG: TonB family protein [Spirochaetales bacterium]|jgi:protein TonB|nr:TonB family protein [Spirochaetales bacterium]